jgi:PKD repeat protein
MITAKLSLRTFSLFLIIASGLIFPKFSKAADTCKADFSFTTSFGNYFFTNLSTCTDSTLGLYDLSYKWDFGDGYTSTYANPNHFFIYAGSYNVTLVVKNPNTNVSDSIVKTIKTKGHCNAELFYEKLDLKLSIYYISRWYFKLDFGDGTIVTDKDSVYTHTYAKGGTYKLCMYKFGDDTFGSCNDTFCTQVTVTDPVYCYAGFGSNQNDYDKKNGLVEFFNDGYYAGQNEKGFAEWDFGDGTKDTGTAKRSYFHQYKKSGNYIVKYKISNKLRNCADSLTKTINVIRYSKADSCRASFSYEEDRYQPGMFTFVGEAFCTAYYYPFTYFYDFGDGTTTSSGVNARHNYLKPGSYTVKFAMKDSKNQVSDTFTNTITTLGLCNAAFTYAQNDLFVRVFISDSRTKKFTLDFGDGFVVTDKDTIRSHTYAAKGSYKICLKVENPDLNCSDEVCKQVPVTDPVYCNANFVVNPNENYYHTIKLGFQDYYAGMNNSTYYWDFGDGTSYTNNGSEFSHTYNTFGKYRIKLKTVNLKSNCTDTSSKIIEIKEIKEDIIGFVREMASDTLGDTAMVYLIKYSEKDSLLSAVDSAVVTRDTSLNTGMFYFRNQSEDKYYLKAALTKGSTNYKVFLPTYFGQKLKWTDAMETKVPGQYIWNNIHLINGVNPGGPGFIGGKISQGANKKEGDPLENIQVMLFDASKNPVAYTYSDIKGKFSFSNLPYGTYEVYTEILGLNTDPGFVTISAANPKNETVEVKVSSSGILTTSIKQKLTEDFLAQPKLYPNPAQNNLYLETDMKKSQAAEIVIYNITGQQVYSENIDLKQGKQIHNIATDKLSAGLYMLQLKNASGTETMEYKFMKTN